MRKDFSAGIFLALMLLMIALGCRGGAIQASSSAIEDTLPSTNAETVGQYLRALASSPASNDIAKVMDSLCHAGILFIVLGGISIIFGGKTSGFTLIGIGALMLSIGVLFIQYPWVVLVVASLAGLIAAISALEAWRTKKALTDKTTELVKEHAVTEKLAETIEKVPEGEKVKEYLKGLGDDVVEMMNEVIDPIKEKLKDDGKIK